MSVLIPRKPCADSRRCHINWVVLDSDWEAELCRVAESHPRVRAYVKNHNLGVEVPYRYGSETRKYLPDFIVLVDDGHGENDLLHLIVPATTQGSRYYWRLVALRAASIRSKRLVRLTNQLLAEVGQQIQKA